FGSTGKKEISGFSGSKRRLERFAAASAPPPRKRNLSFRSGRRSRRACGCGHKDRRRKLESHGTGLRDLEWRRHLHKTFLSRRGRVWGAVGQSAALSRNGF